MDIPAGTQSGSRLVDAKTAAFLREQAQREATARKEAAEAAAKAKRDAEAAERQSLADYIDRLRAEQADAAAARDADAAREAERAAEYRALFPGASSTQDASKPDAPQAPAGGTGEAAPEPFDAAALAAKILERR